MENMTELERKFIIMARIAVALRRKGIHASASIHEAEYCSLSAIVFNRGTGDCALVEGLESTNCTEQELLDWWAEIERV